MANEPKRSLNFIQEIIEADRQACKNEGRVHTRFPPEPNGYLHIGHAKSICLNFGLAERYGWYCNLRFDDTNPAKEEASYVEAIKQDVRWLGFDWRDRIYFASDYFERMYRHHRVNRMTAKVGRVVRELFDHYLAAPNCLPEEWRAQAEGAETQAKARLVADYIAGMTDRFALEEHRKLFDPYAKT